MIKKYKKLFGWYTISLSSIYFIAAIYQAIAFFTSQDINKYGISVLVFPLSLIFIGIGIMRIYVAKLLFNDRSNNESFYFAFGLFCFAEIVFVPMYGLALVEEFGITGTVVATLFLLYYILALPFVKRLKKT